MSDNLFTSKNFIISALENSYDGICIADKCGHIIYTNESYEKIINSNDFKDTVNNMIKHVIQSTTTFTLHKATSYEEKFVLTANPIFNKTKQLAAIAINVSKIYDITSIENKKKLSEAIISYYKNQILDNSILNNLVCESPKTIKVFSSAHKAAQTDSTILLSGETGVGKEVVAEYIHYNSRRNDKNYLKINCGAIPENLIESEFFGYVKGAFTGADPKGKSGLFELADKGTLFLDEIGELSLSLQSSLLRALDNGEIKRLGSTKTKIVDVRIIAATNKNLYEMVEKGTFRKDLYYRLNVISINIPPLRERLEDIPAFANLFIDKLNKKYNTTKHLSESFILQLVAKPWYGNVRELSNFIEKQFILNNNDILLSINENESISSNYYSDNFNMEKAVNSIEASLIKSALKHCNTHNDAAHMLGISQPTFSRKYNKYKKMGLL